MMPGGNGGGRRGSLIAEQYARGERIPKDAAAPLDRHPTNEEVAKAVQQKVATAVEMSRKYRHVAWYALFVAAYMIVLYFQANAYHSGEVVEALKAAFLPEGSASSTIVFKNEDDVLNYIGTKILLPIWKDPVCGDGNCEWPWEFPAWGKFGCRADCGTNYNVTKIAVNVKADFTGHPTISPMTLMASAAWNLCLEDAARRARGEADLCWYATDQQFTSVQVNSLSSMSVVDGNWYVIVKGDYAGMVHGVVYDINDEANPQQVSLMPAWEKCTLQPGTAQSGAASAVRRLLQTYVQASQTDGEHAQRLITEAVESIKAMPELAHIDFAAYERTSGSGA